MKRGRLLAFLALALLALPARGTEGARLTPATEKLVLDDFAEVLVDPSCSLSIAEVTSPPASARFARLSSIRNLGFTSACVWVRVAVENVGHPRTWAFAWPHALVERIDFYLPRAGGFEDRLGGLEVPPRERGMAQHGTFHEADVSMTEGERLTLHLRLKTRATMLLGLDAWAPEALRSFEHRMLFAFALSLGALLVLALLHLYSFFTLRDRSYLWFFLVLVTSGAYQLAETGIAEWLWPPLSAFGLRLPPLLASLAIASGLLFARRFLDVRRFSPRLDETGLALAWVVPAAGLTALADVRFATIAVAVLGFAALALLLAWGVHSVARGFSPARHFLAAAACFLAFGLGFLLTVVGVLPPTVFLMNGIHIGLSLAGLIFTFALADRLEDLQRRARDELEGEVQSRTRTLKETVEALRQRADELLRAESARTETEERFRLAFKTSPEAIAILRLEDARYVAVNDGFVEATGWGEAEAVGRTIAELGVWNAPDWERVLAGLADPGQVRSLDLTFRRRDGTSRDGVLSANVLTVDAEPLVLSIVRDVTEHRRAERDRGRLEGELLRSQKMEAIGRLAGGVAHDFNNLLTAVSTQVALLLLDTAATDPRRAALDEIQEAVRGASAFTRQLLAFGRRQPLEARPLSLNSVVASTERIVGRLLGEHVTLHLHLAPDLPPLFADPALVEQVVLNLVVNARDALPGGGRIAVATREEVVPPSAATAEKRAGRYLSVSVSDTGGGMDPDTLSHVFEPFFRGADGPGAGLGLSTVYGIARQHGGFVEVESREGAGSTFRVFFPVAQGGAARAPPPEDAAAPLPRGKESVLLAEDDAAVRGPTAALLERLGYRVHAAADGVEALAIADRVGGIDLLVADLVLPHMGGRSLARAVASRFPAVRVLYLSGYAPGDAAAGEAGGPRASFLAKPWAPAVLARKLREVLDEPPASG